MTEQKAWEMAQDFISKSVVLELAHRQHTEDLRNPNKSEGYLASSGMAIQIEDLRITVLHKKLTKYYGEKFPDERFDAMEWINKYIEPSTGKRLNDDSNVVYISSRKEMKS